MMLRSLGIFDSCEVETSKDEEHFGLKADHISSVAASQLNARTDMTSSCMQS